MQPGALGPYEEALADDTRLHVQHRDGRVVELDVPRWLAHADAVDLDVARRCVSPVLDAGCGPGRMVEALVRVGRFAIGVDIATVAVELAAARGVTVLRRDLFARLPGEGRWRTVLLLDGNIGIGGDLDRLLARVVSLLAADGRVIVETHPDPDLDERQLVRFVSAGVALGPEFPWRYVGSAALERAAVSHRLAVVESWAASGRTFVTLRRAVR